MVTGSERQKERPIEHMNTPLILFTVIFTITIKNKNSATGYSSRYTSLTPWWYVCASDMYFKEILGNIANKNKLTAYL